MRLESDEVVILTRTLMAGGVCVGAYDVANSKMIRLLGPTANRLTAEAPYEVGEVYSMAYAVRYKLSAPHTEDVAVYEAKCLGEYDTDDFDGLIDSLTDELVNPGELFDGKPKWEPSGFILPDDSPSFSVQIASLECDLVKNGEHFEQKKWGVTIKRMKYVGEKPISQLPSIIRSGRRVRFSLARFWDKGDGVERAYLQISGVY